MGKKVERGHESHDVKALSVFPESTPTLYSLGASTTTCCSSSQFTIMIIPPIPILLNFLSSIMLLD